MQSSTVTIVISIDKDRSGKLEVFNVSRSKRLQGRFTALRLATKVAGLALL